MNRSGPTILTPSDAGWPDKISGRLGTTAPKELYVIGPVSLLSLRKTALFCSARAPGDVILRAHDTARQLRDQDVTIISGFHSPIEKDCLRVLLRGKQPVIICLGRSIKKLRLPSVWRAALDAGRLRILSPFERYPPRPTTESARYRNELVAALADEVLIIHATPGGGIERISELVDQWRIPKKALRSESC